MTAEVDPMFSQLDRTVPTQAEAADIITECAQLASGYPIAYGDTIELTTEQKTLNFFRRVRKWVFSKPLKHTGTREELDRIIGGLEDNCAVSLTVATDGDITKINAGVHTLGDIRRAADAGKENADADRREQARRAKQYRRQRLRSV